MNFSMLVHYYIKHLIKFHINLDRDVNIAQIGKLKRIPHNNQANFDMNYKEKSLQHY